MILLCEAMEEQRVRRRLQLDQIIVQQRHARLRDIHLLLQRHGLATLIQRIYEEHPLFSTPRRIYYHLRLNKIFNITTCRWEYTNTSFYSPFYIPKKKNGQFFLMKCSSVLKSVRLSLEVRKRGSRLCSSGLSVRKWEGTRSPPRQRTGTADRSSCSSD